MTDSKLLEWLGHERDVFMSQSRPPYPEQFRREAVQLVRGGRSVKDVAKSLGCSEQALHVWVKRFELDHRERDDGLRSDEREELRICAGA